MIDEVALRPEDYAEYASADQRQMMAMEHVLLSSLRNGVRSIRAQLPMGPAGQQQQQAVQRGSEDQQPFMGLLADTRGSDVPTPDLGTPAGTVDSAHAAASGVHGG